MQVFVGQTRSRKLIARLTALGLGEMTNRSEPPPRRFPYAFDNGAFKDWTYKVNGQQVGRPFQEETYLQSLRVVAEQETPPQFLVVPDIVGGGLASREFSLAWAPRVAGVAPLYFAVQDGMGEEDVLPVLSGFAGIFVGGSLPWKIRTGAAWVAFAHRRGMPCHIGRVGVPNRIRWCQRIGADSIDSCLPLWSDGNLARFLRALKPSAQMEL